MSYAREGSAGGTISPAGSYTAPAAPGIYHVIFTAQADLSQTASATVRVAVPFTGGGADARDLVPLVYRYVRDSDGQGLAAGNLATLSFEPNGTALLYLASATDVLAYHGPYTFDGGRLTLKFSESDFHPDVRFSLDPAAPSVTMPFGLFSEGSVTSRWERTSIPVEDQLYLLFNALLFDGETLTVPQVIGRLCDFTAARALLNRQTSVSSVALPLQVLGVAAIPRRCPSQSQHQSGLRGGVLHRRDPGPTQRHPIESLFCLQ